jgi:predicted TIM-barrel fold metal-dependent hydrolase
MPGLQDEEGGSVPEGLPPVIDGHVHLFPDEIFSSIRRWFKKFGWPIRYRLTAPEAVGFLLDRGVFHIVAHQYAHRPGVAPMLNQFMADVCDRYPQVTGMATVFPGEEDTVYILREAFDMGLNGVKLHSHVQCFDVESRGMHDVYRVCVEEEKPLLMHVGREPKSPAYDCDPYELCSAAKVERIIRAYPKLRVCVPHLGADEFEDYQRMLEQYDTIWLDTTMMLADYLPADPPPLEEMRLDRIIYGTDFPNIPYAWDRELKRLCAMGLSEGVLSRILGENAKEFFSISEGC